MSACLFRVLGDMATTGYATSIAEHTITDDPEVAYATRFSGAQNEAHLQEIPEALSMEFYHHLRALYSAPIGALGQGDGVLQGPAAGPLLHGSLGQRRGSSGD
eukprot:4909552-Pyramimonas_sp.AAC.1